MASKDSTPDDGVPVVRIEEVAIVDLASLLDDDAPSNAGSPSAAKQSAFEALLSNEMGQASAAPAPEPEPEPTPPPVLKKQDKVPTPIHIDIDMGGMDTAAPREDEESLGGVFKVDIDGLDDFEALLQRTMGEAAGVETVDLREDTPKEIPRPRDGAARRKAAITATSAKWRTPKRETPKDNEQSGGTSAAIEELRKKVKEMATETESYRKRLQEEAKATRGKGREDVFKALMPIMDALELALKSMHEGHEIEQLTEGIEMVRKRLTTDLGLLGLETIAPQGEPFDPTMHEAFQQVTTGKVAPGMVAEVVRNGFRFEERLLRAAQVLVEKA